MPGLWRRHLAQKIPVSLTVSADLCIPRLQMQVSKDSVQSITLGRQACRESRHYK